MYTEREILEMAGADAYVEQYIRYSSSSLARLAGGLLRFMRRFAVEPISMTMLVIVVALIKEDV